MTEIDKELRDLGEEIGRLALELYGKRASDDLNLSSAVTLTLMNIYADRNETDKIRNILHMIRMHALATIAKAAAEDVN